MVRGRACRGYRRGICCTIPGRGSLHQTKSGDEWPWKPFSLRRHPTPREILLVIGFEPRTGLMTRRNVERAHARFCNDQSIRQFFSFLFHLSSLASSIDNICFYLPVGTKERILDVRASFFFFYDRNFSPNSSHFIVRGAFLRRAL